MAPTGTVAYAHTLGCQKNGSVIFAVDPPRREDLRVVEIVRPGGFLSVPPGRLFYPLPLPLTHAGSSFPELLPDAMVFNFRERKNSRDQTHKPPTITMRYVATGEHDNATVHALALSLTSPIVAVSDGLLYRQDVKLEPAGYEMAALFCVPLRWR